MEKLSERKPAATGKKSVGQILSDLSMPILLLMLIIIFSILSPNFFTPVNLTNILVQNVHIAVCSCAVMMIMVSGGTDLSIGYQMSVAAVLMAKTISEGILPVPVAVILGILLCMLLGMSERIVVLHEGHQTGILNRDEFSQETVMTLASG